MKLVYCEKDMKLLNVNQYIRLYISKVYNDHSNYLEILKKNNFDLLVKILYVDYCKMNYLNNDLVEFENLTDIEYEKLIINNELYLSLNDGVKSYFLSMDLGIEKYNPYGLIEKSAFTQLATFDLLFKENSDLLKKVYTVNLEDFVTNYEKELKEFIDDIENIEEFTDDDALEYFFEDIEENYEGEFLFDEDIELLDEYVENIKIYDSFELLVIGDFESLIFDKYGENFYDLGISNEQLCDDLSDEIENIKTIYKYNVTDVYDFLENGFQTKPFDIFIEDAEELVSFNKDEKIFNLFYKMSEELVSTYLLGNKKTERKFFEIIKKAYILSSYLVENLEIIKDENCLVVELIDNYLLKNEISKIELIDSLLLSDFPNFLILLMDNYMQYKNINNKSEIFELLSTESQDKIKTLKKL